MRRACISGFQALRIPDHSISSGDLGSLKDGRRRDVLVKCLFKRRKGLSPVISAIILSAVVIAVGGMVWSYAQGASSIIAMDYVNGTMNLLNEITERFTVEHVSNNSDGSLLSVWVSNYGEVTVNVDVYADVNSSGNSTMATLIETGELVQIDISFESHPLTSGEAVAIQVYSRRQNSAYSTYIVQ